MDLMHKTTVDEVPYSMCSFQGKVLIGLGKTLRLYDYGKKKLLKKSENKVRALLNRNSFFNLHCDESYNTLKQS
jgi:hypothetical protein